MQEASMPFCDIRLNAKIRSGGSKTKRRKQAAKETDNVIS
jgi:hypothetical protein